MDPQLKSNLTSSKHWIRLIYMVLFAIAVYAAAVVISLVIIVQFLFALVTGTANRNLRSLGYSLATYIRQSLDFLTFNSEQKPFPFADWPNASLHEDVADTVIDAVVEKAVVEQPIAEKPAAETSVAENRPVADSAIDEDASEGKDKPASA